MRRLLVIIEQQFVRNCLHFCRLPVSAINGPLMRIFVIVWAFIFSRGECDCCANDRAALSRIRANRISSASDVERAHGPATESLSARLIAAADDSRRSDHITTRTAASRVGGNP